jgi:hypothetical protein
MTCSGLTVEQTFMTQLRENWEGDPNAFKDIQWDTITHRSFKMAMWDMG